MSSDSSYADLLPLMEERLLNQLPFAVFRLPHEGLNLYEVGLSHVAKVREITAEELQKRSDAAGFVVAPFLSTPDRPMLFIEGGDGAQAFCLSSAEIGVASVEHTSVNLSAELPEDYRTAFEHFMNQLQSGEVAKLVLAHSMELPSVDITRVVIGFVQALECYPSAFVALFYTPQSGLWLSATPEMLLRGGGQEWQSVALAGTMERQQSSTLACWSEKNKREHQFVCHFISDLLQAEEIPFTTHPIESIPSGDLQHLQARFSFQLPKGYAPITLAAKLHPTPAICGTPQKMAREIILEEEQCSRSYYSGYIGWYEPLKRVDLFVHIRCLQLLPNRALRLYAGGGIVLGSQLETEWAEVLQKMKAIYSLL